MQKFRPVGTRFVDIAGCWILAVVLPKLLHNEVLVLYSVLIAQLNPKFSHGILSGQHTWGYFFIAEVTMGLQIHCMKIIMFWRSVTALPLPLLSWSPDSLVHANETMSDACKTGI